MHNWSYASRYGRTAAVFVVDLVEGQDLSESYVRDYSASNSATALSEFVGNQVGKFSSLLRQRLQSRNDQEAMHHVSTPINV